MSGDSHERHDADRFEFYLCTVDDADGCEYPASVRFSHRAGELAPDTSRPHRVDVSVAILEPTPAGMPTDEEAEQLWALEELLVGAARPQGALLVGILTAKARREWFFHTSDGPALADAFRTALVDHEEQGDRDVRLEGYVDPEWRYFRNALWPNDLAWRFVHDMRVVEALAGHGDDGSEPRPVEHFAYFPDAQSRGAYLEHLRAEGFGEIELHDEDERPTDDPPTDDSPQADSPPTDSRDDERFGVSFKREDRPHSIMPVTGDLTSVAAELGGRYDGWGCAVVTPDDE